MMRRLILISTFVFLLPQTQAKDIPGGITRGSASLPLRSYKVSLSPQILFENGGAYLTANLGYQAGPDIRLTGTFGTGEIGFNVGGLLTWTVLPDLEKQPAFSFSTGVYYNQINEADYFTFRMIPAVSKNIPVRWGTFQPFLSLQLLPSFGTGTLPNHLAMRSHVGANIKPKATEDLEFWVELGINLAKSHSEMTLGMAYPF